MTTFDGKVQALLRKFLYNGCVSGFTETNHHLTLALRDHVKLEVGATSKDFVACSGGVSDCQIIETRSTPSKSREPDVVVICEVATDEQVESRKRQKNYDQNCHLQESWTMKFPWAESVVGESDLIVQLDAKYVVMWKEKRSASYLSLTY